MKNEKEMIEDMTKCLNGIVSDWYHCATNKPIDKVEELRKAKFYAKYVLKKYGRLIR
jgi:hypothetical protein